MRKILLLLSLLFSLTVNGQILKNYQGQIISKNGKVMSAPEGITFISVQPASLNQVTITLKIDSGQSVLINWGDGSTATANGTGSNVSYTSTYANNNSTYLIQLTGNLDYVRRFEINESTIKFSSTTQLAKLTGLQELYWNLVDFNNLNINILPSSLTYFYVNLSSARGTIMGDISLKTGLTFFDIQSQPNTLSGSITELAMLTRLFVYGSNTLSGSVAGLTALTYINIGGSNTISGSIAGLTALTNITVAGSNTLSGSVAGLTALTAVNVTGSNTLSGSIAGLTALTAVSIQGSNTLSGSIAGLTALTVVSVQGSNTLSGSIAGLTALTVLNVTGSNTISGSIAGLTALTNITVTGSNTLTGSISSLTSLTTLIVTGSNTLSGSISSLMSLLTFEISGSSITSLNCASLTALTSLKQYNNSNLTSFTAPTSTANLATVYLYSDALTTIDFTPTVNIGGDIRVYSNPSCTTLTFPATLTRVITRLDAHGNALDLTSVDNALSKLDTYFTANTPTVNLTVDFTGGTNTSPTGGGSNTNKLHLESIFLAAGKLASISVN